MKLTPWMLTIATFCMVAVIAVSYLFKNSATVVQPEQRLAGQRGWVLPPASIGTPLLPPATQAMVPRVAEAEPTVQAPETAVQEFAATQTETYTPGLPTPTESTVQTNENSVEPTFDDEPIDPLFGDSAEQPFEERTTDEPAKPGFVTQQFRSGDRTDVRFVGGEAIREHVAQGSTKSTN